MRNGLVAPMGRKGRNWAEAGTVHYWKALYPSVLVSQQQIPAFSWCDAFTAPANVSWGQRMDPSKLFGKRVRTLRKAGKLTQEKAAEAAHLNSKYLGEIERGEKRPSFEAIMALAKALNVSPEIFFRFERDETDERNLRNKIAIMLQGTSAHQLQLVHKVVKALLET